MGPEHQEQLTHFNDAEEEITVHPVLPYSQLHAAIDNPFPKQVPSAILTRNYLVYETLWSDFIPAGNLEFPALLLAQSAIIDALSSFLYFRAGIKLEIRMNSTPYHMGAIMVSWLPCTLVVNPPLFQASAFRPITLSASTQQAATTTIPYLSPKTWINLDEYDGGEICTVYLNTLAELITTSPDVSTDVHVQVYASFCDVEVAGYVPSIPSRVTKGKVTRVIPQAEVRTAGSRNDPVNQEAQNKTRTGTATVPSLGYFIRPLLRQIPIIGGIIDPIIDVFKVIFGVMDKPTGVPVVQPVSFDMSRDMSQAAGVDNAQTLSLYPTPSVSRIKGLMGGETSDMSFNQLASIPMLHKTYILDTAQTQFSIHCVPEATDNPEGRPDFLFVAFQCHQWWRGSIKYYFQFFTTAFTSCRVRISLNYVNWTSSVTTSGDIISKIVDIKGDTNVSITVPYLAETHWRRQNVDDTFPILVTELITPIIGQSQVSDSTIYVCVWRSGGPDMQFSLVTPVPIFTSESRVVIPQCDIRSTFKKSFDPIIDGCSHTMEKGFVQCEISGAISDVLKRYVLDVTDNNTFPTPLQVITLQMSTWSWLSHIWMFWRGSRRKKHFAGGDPGTLFTVCPTSDFYATHSSGGNMTVPNVYPIVGTEIPWYHNMPYYFVYPLTAAITSDVPIGITAFGSTIEFSSFIAAGEDFQLGFLTAPLSIGGLVRREIPRVKPVLKALLRNSLDVRNKQTSPTLSVVRDT